MLEEQINKDYIEAMKAKDSLRSSTLSFLRAELKNLMINNKLEKIEDEEAIKVIKKQIKQRQDSIAQFEKGGRQDLSDKEKAELDILKTYLPEEMPDDELQSIVDQAIQEAGASSMKDMGAVMKAAMPKIAGRADNKKVSDTVKQKLSQL